MTTHIQLIKKLNELESGEEQLGTLRFFMADLEKEITQNIDKELWRNPEFVEKANEIVRFRFSSTLYGEAIDPKEILERYKAS